MSLVILSFQVTVFAGIYVILEWLFVIGIAWLHTHWTVLTWSDWAGESRSTSTRIAGTKDIVQVGLTNWWCLVGRSLEIHQRNRSCRKCTDVDWISEWLSFCIHVIYSDIDLACIMFTICDFQHCFFYLCYMLAAILRIRPSSLFVILSLEFAWENESDLFCLPETWNSEYSYLLYFEVVNHSR